MDCTCSLKYCNPHFQAFWLHNYALPTRIALCVLFESYVLYSYSLLWCCHVKKSQTRRVHLKSFLYEQYFLLCQPFVHTMIPRYICHQKIRLHLTELFKYIMLLSKWGAAHIFEPNCSKLFDDKLSHSFCLLDADLSKIDFLRVLARMILRPSLLTILSQNVALCKSLYITGMIYNLVVSRKCIYYFFHERTCYYSLNPSRAFFASVPFVCARRGWGGERGEWSSSML